MKGQQQTAFQASLVVSFNALEFDDVADFTDNFFYYMQAEIRVACEHRGYDILAAVNARTPRHSNVRQWVRIALESRPAGVPSQRRTSI